MNTPTRLPKDQQPTIRVLPMPADTNAAGDVFGGWLMSQVDIAGSIEAHRYTNTRVVTIAVQEFLFLNPVFIGDLISLYTEIMHVGNTSIRIKIDGYTQRQRGSEETHKVAEAQITYVAIDENRHPCPIVRSTPSD